ncbi:MAG: BON domain-containing protein [Burkholderiaceae bacterium]|nr:BON domain-containing protein [Burkholderiaceae bacterium]
MRADRTGHLSAILAVVLTALLVSACASCPDSPSFGEYVEDTAITLDLKGRLLTTGDLSAVDISVSTYRGVVLLSGFVSRDEQISKAEDIARSVGGVKDVKNNLVLRKQVNAPGT